MIIDTKVTPATSPHGRARLRVEYITDGGHQRTFMMFHEAEQALAHICAQSLCGVTDIDGACLAWSERRAEAEPMPTHSPKRRARRVR